jgi:hypothetical protein
MEPLGIKSWTVIRSSPIVSSLGALASPVVILLPSNARAAATLGLLHDAEEKRTAPEDA